MKTDKVKEYLQRYLDSALHKKAANINFTVHDVVKGTYNPPMIHVFIDTDPETTTDTWDTPNRANRKFDSYIEDFFQMLSIPNKIKVHWNKRPIFKKGKEYDKDI